MESTQNLCACGCHNYTERKNKYLPGHKKATSSLARFLSHINKTETCWLWTASLHPDGYARHFHNGKLAWAHRHAYELAHGPIPAGLLVDHICGARSCVNPERLRLATPSQNQENLHGLRSHNTSGFRGVMWDKKRELWIAAARKDGKRYHGGSFSKIEDAAEAARQLRIKLFTHNASDRAGK